MKPIRFFSRLSTLGQLLLIAGLPATTMLVLGGISAYERTHQLSIQKSQGEAARLISSVSTLVHNLQTERGLSVSLFQRKDDYFFTAINPQRKKTDLALSEFLQLLLNSKCRTKDCKKNRIDETKRILDFTEKLKTKRDAVDQQILNIDSTIDFFTDQIHSLFHMVLDQTNTSFDSKTESLISTFSKIHKAKESFGIQRASISAAILNNSFGASQIPRLQKLATEERASIGSFFDLAPAEIVKFYSREVTGSDIDRANRLQRKILEGSTPKALGVTAKDWFELASAKINALRLVEEKITTTMIEHSLLMYNDAMSTLLLYAVPIIFIFGVVVFTHRLLIKRILSMETQLKRSAEQEKLANRAKTDFLSHLSHEIRNPLNAIVGASDLLSESDSENQKNPVIKILDRASNHLHGLVDDVLDLSKIESGNMELVLGSFDLKEQLQTVKEILEVKAKEKNLFLKISMAEGIENILVGDAKRIRQVLINLIGNAIKFTYQGGVTVSVEQISLKNSIANIRFSITDTGVGIPLSKQEQVFKSFKQADLDTAHKFGGTGLGLAISKRIVTLSGGKIDISSQEGKGSTFFFTLPMQVERRQITKEIMDRSSDEKSFSEQLEPFTVLLADDSEDNHLLVGKFLSPFKCKMDSAENGRVALEKFIENPNYDIVIVDMQMPIMDGLTAIKEIRKWEITNQRNPVPIIGLSGNALRSEIETAIAAGCNSYLTKPVRKSVLSQEVVRQLRDRKSQQKHKISAA